MKRAEGLKLRGGEGEYLYKYRSLNREGSPGRSAYDRTRDLFLNHRMWLATLQSFNDPFEGRVHISVEAAEAQELAKLRGHLAKIGKIPPEHELRRIIRNTEADLVGRRKGVTRTFGVLSLTANPQSILMWSHYADSHCGICIQLTAVADETTDFVGSAVSIEYAESIPHVNFYTHEDFEFATASILTKARDWEYESEYRIVKPESGYLPMPRGQISGVIFGYRASDDDKQEVCQWVDSLGYPVDAYEAVMNESNYSLDIVST